MEKIVFLLTVGLCALSAPAWDVEHDEVAQLTGEFLPREVQAWFSFADFGVLLASCHTPDLIEWPMEGGVRRYRNAAEIAAMTSPAALAAFRSCGFADTANWFHKPKGRAALMAVMARAFATGDGRTAAFCLSTLSHATSDTSALNHPPLLQFVQYSRFTGVDYAIRKVEEGAKNVFGFRSDGPVVRRVRELLTDFAPQAAAGGFAEATLRLIADEPREAAYAAEQEGTIAFAPRDVAVEALARLVAMQVRLVITMAWTSWVNRAPDAALPGADFDRRFEDESNRVIRRLEPAKMAVFRGIFDETLNPATPKGVLAVVCEPHSGLHSGRLLFVGRMLAAAAARTARDLGWAVKGVSFWRIADSDVLPKPEKGVKLLVVAGGGDWVGAEAVADKLKAWREHGGELIYVGGDDPRNISGFRDSLEAHPDEELPTSTKWGLAGASDWRQIALVLNGERVAMRRCGSFDGFCKPVCRYGLKTAEVELARLACGEREFVVAARKGAVTWLPAYALMPFFFSDDTTANWAELRLDSFGTRLFGQVMSEGRGGR